MKRILKILTSKVTVIGLFVLLQIIIFGIIITFLDDNVPYFFVFSYGLSIILVLFILRSDELDTYKLAWVLAILIAPIFGGLFYLTFKPYNLTRKLKKSAQKKVLIRKEATKDLIKPITDVNIHMQKQITYLQQDYWPYYENTSAVFLPSGEAKLRAVLKELRKAEKFIFLEYFILEEVGLVWENIYPILKAKAKEGLDVRVIYDDFGSSTRINFRFRRRLERDGIKVIAFNPMRLKFVVSHNNRNHKKIIVIDGKIAFTGGINIADEYVNLKKRFGIWQDTGIMLEGDAVYSMTISFLESWNSQTNDNCKYEDYKVSYKVPKDGYVIPFSDSPHQKNYLSVNLYMQMIASAEKEIYITTPYFIVDESFINVLKLQALSGVKIHIIVPGIPDKKFAYVVTKYNLKQLADLDNIYIYSYTPGFIHSKLLYIDGKAVTIGTVNFDFRSFYLHFENTVVLYENKVISDVKNFLDQTIKECNILTYNDLQKRNLFYKIYETFLVIFAHLL